MEFDASPVKKKRRKNNRNKTVRPTTCLIHVDEDADDETMSCFTAQSWKVFKSFLIFGVFNNQRKSE